MTSISRPVNRVWLFAGGRVSYAGPTRSPYPPPRPTASPVLLDDNHPLPERFHGALFQTPQAGTPGSTFVILPTGIHAEQPRPEGTGNRLFSAADPGLRIRRKAISVSGSAKDLPPPLIDLHQWQDGTPQYELLGPDSQITPLRLVPYLEALSYLGFGATIPVDPKSALIVPSSTFTGDPPASLGLSSDKPTLRLTTSREFDDLHYYGHLPSELRNLIRRRSGPNDIISNFRLLVLSLGTATSEIYGIEVVGVTEHEGNLTVHYRKTSRKGGLRCDPLPTNPAAFILVSNRYFFGNKDLKLEFKEFGI